MEAIKSQKGIQLGLNMIVEMIVWVMLNKFATRDNLVHKVLWK